MKTRIIAILILLFLNLGGSFARPTTKTRPRYRPRSAWIKAPPRQARKEREVDRYLLFQQKRLPIYDLVPFRMDMDEVNRYTGHTLEQDRQIVKPALPYLLSTAACAVLLFALALFRGRHRTIHANLLQLRDDRKAYKPTLREQLTDILDNFNIFSRAHQAWENSNKIKFSIRGEFMSDWKSAPRPSGRIEANLLGIGGAGNNVVTGIALGVEAVLQQMKKQGNVHLANLVRNHIAVTLVDTNAGTIGQCLDRLAGCQFFKQQIVLGQESVTFGLGAGRSRTKAIQALIESRDEANHKLGFCAGAVHWTYGSGAKATSYATYIPIVEALRQARQTVFASIIQPSYGEVGEAQYKLSQEMIRRLSAITGLMEVLNEGAYKEKLRDLQTMYDQINLHIANMMVGVVLATAARGDFDHSDWSDNFALPGARFCPSSTSFTLREYENNPEIILAKLDECLQDPPPYIAYPGKDGAILVTISCQLPADKVGELRTACTEYLEFRRPGLNPFITVVPGLTDTVYLSMVRSNAQPVQVEPADFTLLLSAQSSNLHPTQPAQLLAMNAKEAIQAEAVVQVPPSATQLDTAKKTAPAVQVVTAPAPAATTAAPSPATAQPKAPAFTVPKPTPWERFCNWFKPGAGPSSQPANKSAASSTLPPPPADDVPDLPASLAVVQNGGAQALPAPAPVQPAAPTTHTETPRASGTGSIFPQPASSPANSQTTNESTNQLHAPVQTNGAASRATSATNHFDSMAAMLKIAEMADLRNEHKRPPNAIRAKELLENGHPDQASFEEALPDRHALFVRMHGAKGKIKVNEVWIERMLGLLYEAGLRFDSKLPLDASLAQLLILEGTKGGTTLDELIWLHRAFEGYIKTHGLSVVQRFAVSDSKKGKLKISEPTVVDRVVESAFGGNANRV